MSGRSTSSSADTPSRLTAYSSSSVVDPACAAHSPNWFLMPVTLVSGYGAIWVYRRYNNLYFLGLAHAMIGFLLFVAVPDSVSHHLNVGPGWFAHPQGHQPQIFRNTSAEFLLPNAMQFASAYSQSIRLASSGM
jgi:hypothetical protein